MNSIGDIHHCFYINLINRPDRKNHVEKQLEKIGLKGTRFNAIKLENGAIGCSMSHLKCLENAKKLGLPHIMIIEDDITFLKPELFIKQFNYFLSHHSNWDVILVAGNNMPPYSAVDGSSIKVQRCQTTTGYIVKNHYFDTLIQNFKEGINLLLKNPDQPRLYAIDKYWFTLQKRDNWYLIIPLSVVQREDYSDIEKRPTNYMKNMMDLDKKDFLVKKSSSSLSLDKMKFI
jgi:GR25 family glycosyltransferase involved in LPS biosynthesis